MEHSCNFYLILDNVCLSNCPPTCVYPNMGYRKSKSQSDMEIKEILLTPVCAVFKLIQSVDS